MHRYDATTEVLAEAVMSYSRERMSMGDVPLDAPRTAAELQALVGQTITAQGMGGEKALRLFGDVLAQACITVDHPRYLSFIPCAPTKAATLFDLVVSASSLYAGTWMEGSGAVYAENQALAWLSGLAGLPESAGGVFVPGGTYGNLSALVAARYRARQQRAADLPRRWAIAGTANAHSSIVSACDVMDVDFVGVPVGEDGRLTGTALRETLARAGHDGVFAVVATAGTTNLGIVDDLDSVGAVCAELGLWFHVDGAYGLAGLAAPSVRHRFDGIERADSFVVDPHKWLFAPFDCCALVYRDPALARAAHTQRAGYLDVVTEGDEINPSDYAVGLTRRARGLPFWFSLATHGTQAYTDAVERTLTVARHAAQSVRERPQLELLHEPDLSVVCFRRVGWTPQDYRAWSQQLLAQDKGFVVSTTHAGETCTRLAVVNPETTEADIDLILDSMV
ncbi:glutamate decarboxylase [Kineosporia sp. NBRC 101677]|uniref:pyridoxal phosphate-dependent decarboxylase family protein n=1 Tax=Kineosporia sp. NBRC 101677 TaxID=3032197 RepID=UPI0024A036F6|nr:aminotransferase class V-fold PLP-dependent enzyme [Kineosporia sp. NBRC 101677]GLY14281.1 glutamate decarboxylase [Kineosporia sp. NBRC 101677]